MYLRRDSSLNNGQNLIPAAINTQYTTNFDLINTGENQLNYASPKQLRVECGSSMAAGNYLYAKITMLELVTASITDGNSLINHIII